MFGLCLDAAMVWSVQGAFICTILIFLVLFVTYTWDYVRSYWDLIERHAHAGDQQAAAPAPAHDDPQPRRPVPDAQAAAPAQPQQAVPDARAAAPAQTVPRPAQPTSEAQPEASAQGASQPNQPSSQAQAAAQTQSLPETLRPVPQIQDEVPQEISASQPQPVFSYKDAQNHIHLPNSSAAACEEASPETSQSSAFEAVEAHATAAPNILEHVQETPANVQTSGASSGSGPSARAAPPLHFDSPAPCAEDDRRTTGLHAPAHTAQLSSTPHRSFPASGSGDTLEDMARVNENAGTARVSAAERPALAGDFPRGPASQDDEPAQPLSGLGATQAFNRPPSVSGAASSPIHDTALARAQGTAQDAHAAAGAEGEAVPEAAHEGAAGREAAGEAAAGAAQDMVVDADALDAAPGDVAGAAPAQAAGAAAAGDNAAQAPGEELQVHDHALPDCGVHWMSQGAAKCCAMTLGDCEILMKVKHHMVLRHWELFLGQG